ncbi:hypothetical protein Glove_109g43 [Diversispora epigaea]|uniref:Protein kinase domain-containing protein n=1 Tax=Diversispora epigaea TaxID=1348612 RepID=A0A397J4R5_9GLOM|nr:hypothetical protein Glove_109g43 [Diversispora epigaea]
MSSDKICPECSQQFTTLRWYKPCNSKHFKDNFDKWTSRNETIDKIIQNTQLNANRNWRAIEWIPYDRLKYIKQLAKGGFGTIHLAEWFDGYGQQKVVLKKFYNFANLNEEFLNEMVIHLKTSYRNASIQFYGITQDLETHKYIMVLSYADGGNLRNYLKSNFNNLNWKKKLLNLCYLVDIFRNIHELDILHKDLHPGNILSYDFNHPHNLNISDFGLKVLGGEEYTKAADVYSFGIVAYEIVTGLSPYYDIPHNKDLAMKICNGLRPKIPFHVSKLITRIIMYCWDARVTHKPTFKELYNKLSKYYSDYYYEYNEIAIQIKKAEEFSTSTNAASTDTTITTPLNYQTHPQAIYTSRLLNFSSLPKPKNEENFEKELDELTKSMDDLSTNKYQLYFLCYLILE